LDGGVTSALQEDMLTHATPSAFKALSILENLETVIGIELLAAAQAYDLRPEALDIAERTGDIYRAIRKSIPPYLDDRPMQEDFDAIRAFMKTYPINQELD
jgi:histidine ammonia-lyase